MTTNKQKQYLRHKQELNVIKKYNELNEWLKTDDAIELLAKMDMRATWIKEMTGNEASWYFSTLSYYPYKHQLATTGIIEDLNIKTFSELPVDGKYVGKRKQYEKVK